MVAGIRFCYIAVCKSSASSPNFTENANRVESLNPPRWTHCKGIVPRLGQKGVEIDPFKVGIVQLFPKSEKSNRRATSHPILNDIFRLDGILQCGYVRDTDIISPIVANYSHNRAIYIEFTIAFHLQTLSKLFV